MQKKHYYISICLFGKPSWRRTGSFLSSSMQPLHRWGFHHCQDGRHEQEYDLICSSQVFPNPRTVFACYPLSGSLLHLCASIWVV